VEELFDALTESELERLDRFLRERGGADASEANKDAGVRCLSELDGLLTAVVSGPITIPPSTWLPAVWGDVEPPWETSQEFKAIWGLMMRHQNRIGTTLMEQPEDFEPLFLRCDGDDEANAGIDRWCEGFRRGMQLAPDQWAAGGEAMDELLVPILAFTEETNWRGHDFMDNDIEIIQGSIAPNARAIHAYWLLRREDPVAPADKPVDRA
jgi:uncharacterized protein